MVIVLLIAVALIGIYWNSMDRIKQLKKWYIQRKTKKLFSRYYVKQHAYRRIKH